MDHRGGDVKNYERPDPCEEQEKREGKEYESHEHGSLAGDGNTLRRGQPVHWRFGLSRNGNGYTESSK